MNLKDFIINALSSKKPSLYFKNNEDVGKEIFPELYKLKAVPESEDYHYHDNTFDHVMMVVDEVAKKTNKLNIRYAALMHDIGKVETKEEILPHHYEHEKKGVDKLYKIASDKLSDQSIDSAAVVIRYHMMIKNWNELRPGTIVDMFNAIYDSPLSMEEFLIIIRADNLKKKNQEKNIPHEEISRIYNDYVKEIKQKNIEDRNKQSLFIANKK
ncbi:HD domain-containing protein [Halanaerobium congolense]|uniref:HDIG domain-containing protein n=1 Tax=Halanaerobium congolense TaxID=54121 RepID=A0A1G6S932_9FIRM|nr:HD domain-containing protein [Halanaerobium congolense]SDD13398.1 HDIG domain-containing protein [Halanaerobium congolense]SHN10108.1 HDIG domain-containing protein [Halanaerobium congolense]